MGNVAWLFVAFGVAYGCALLVPLWAMAARGRFVVVAGWMCAACCMATPLLLPAHCIGLRTIAVFVAAELAFKLIDFVRGRNRAWDGRLVRDYCRFLVPFPVLAVVYPDHTKRLANADPVWPHLLWIVVGVAFLTAALPLTRAVSTHPALQAWPWVEHFLRVLIFVPVIETLSRVLYGLERLAGFDTKPVVRNAYLSRTVAEFWMRYNYRIHDWLYRHAFRPAGARRAPVRSVLAVFFVSGLFHEFGFALATSRITGYQFAFFALQAPAVLASRRLERIAKHGGVVGRIVAHGTTILFLSATSVLFFHGVSQVFPWVLASGSPLP